MTYRRMSSMIRAAVIGGADVTLTTIGNPHARGVGQQFVARHLGELADLLADTLARRCVERDDTGAYVELERIVRRAKDEAYAVLSLPPPAVAEWAKPTAHLAPAERRKRRA